MEVKVNYNAMDVVKFLLAILLVCAHTASERVSLPIVLDLCCSLYIIAVPFFFIASSFLFFRKIDSLSEKEQKISYKKYTMRIGGMYLAWSSVYFCFIFVKWIQNGSGWQEILKYFHQSIVFSTYPTIWFLPALWIGVSLVYLCRYKLNWSSLKILLVSIFLYCLGAIGYSYHSLNPITESLHQAYTTIFVTWRNGFFNAFIYATLGYILSVVGFPSMKKNMLGTVFFGFAFLIEAFVMKYIVPSSDANFLFFLVPFSYFFFSLVCQIELPDSKSYSILRQMSMLIFVSQRLFLTAIPSVVVGGAGPWDWFENGVFALLLLVLEVCVFSYLLIVLSKKIKVLKYLM